MPEDRPGPRVCWRVLTPTAAPGAVAIIAIDGAAGADIDAALGTLGLPALTVGRVALRRLAGFECAVVARWSGTSLHLMVHGGPAVVRGVGAWLSDLGIGFSGALDPIATYPEARDDLEARMLHALALAASPLAVDLLLDQPRRWRLACGQSPAAPQTLRHLIHPPLVVALGASNVGKSTLANALAGRCVSIVADEPGTTRDHVGAILDLAGLVVRYADTPGIRDTDDPTERAAVELSLELARRADLVLLMGDSGHPPVAPPSVAAPTMRVALRSDLGLPGWRHDRAVCALTGQGLRELVLEIRQRLVPAADLATPHPWVFWESAGMEGGAGEP